MNILKIHLFSLCKLDMFMANDVVCMYMCASMQPKGVPPSSSVRGEPYLVMWGARVDHVMG